MVVAPVESGWGCGPVALVRLERERKGNAGVNVSTGLVGEIYDETKLGLQAGVGVGVAPPDETVHMTKTSSKRSFRISATTLDGRSELGALMQKLRCSASLPDPLLPSGFGRVDKDYQIQSPVIPPAA